MLRLKDNVTPGEHRLNVGAVGISSLDYAGELFKSFLQQQEIPVKGTISPGIVPAKGRIFYRHLSSKQLKEIIPAMMLYSNNYIANQLFLVCGAATRGFPATWDKGRFCLTHFLGGIGIKDTDFKIIDGSGLSRQNKISPRAMINILDAFKDSAHMLPVSGQSYIKSGTLKNVYSYAGYLSHRGNYDPFVIMLNQKKNTRDILLKDIRSFYSTN